MLALKNRHLAVFSQCYQSVRFASSNSLQLDLTSLNPLSKTSKSVLETVETPAGAELARTRERMTWLQPREDALSSRLTGVIAGRTVDVYKGDTANAMRQLNSVLAANNVLLDRRSQRFYMKPGKVAEVKRSRRHRKEFKKGFQRLIDLVKDAKRKGY